MDVHSPNFKPRSWIKSLLHLTAQDPSQPQSRTAGFCFKDLNVYGFGSDVDYQRTVGNLPLQVINIAKKLVGLGGKRRIDILSGLDGVVHAGELLVVLGQQSRLAYVSFIH